VRHSHNRARAYRTRLGGRRLSVLRRATVEVDGLAGEPARFGGREIDDGGADIAGTSESAYRYPLVSAPSS
jgi:hypothetical protein